MTDMIVAGAGTTAVNGTYAEYGTRDGKTRYRMISAESVSGYFYIVWYRNVWWISIRGEDAEAGVQIMSGSRYRSADNAATPDLVTTWSTTQGAVPVPTVTAASSGTTHEGEVALSSLSYLRTKKA